ncbi:MAG TPA: hypothetical protein PK024_02140 [Methanospirillum sp.]|uniref:hypothetical protein n=1 Tax=Methanospirillum sp. TaxID=45200 RepID=UPI002CFE62E9|nr:hypothetical protein [Methanospirillum sp.]HOJ95628.1 hypothetical protein [Methanospirillum sp.]HPP77132.1 hypothetical protein [Methanospirillum sp.]
MSKFIGYEPKPKTAKVTEEFENKVLIRRNNKNLVGRVYVDVMDDEWKVAVGYNQMGISKLHGRENEFEVLYRYQPSEESKVIRLGTDTDLENEYPLAGFSSPDEFIIWAVGQEKQIQLSPV